MASITVDINVYDLNSIGIAAGQTDINQMFYDGSEFHVNGVTQEALDSALASASTIDPNAVALAKQTEDALNAIDIKAGEVRERFISCGVGMELTYEQKRHEAEDFKTAGYPEAQIADYPFVEAEAIATNDTGQQAADFILAKCAAWKAAGSQIEMERRKGKILIEQQLSITGIETARDTTVAILDAITP